MSDVVRNLRLKLSILGTKQTDRSLKGTTTAIDQLGQKTEVTSQKTEDLAGALLKSSEAADKKLKKFEGMFAGTDRFLSILTKATGALGLAAIAYKGVTKAVEFFTGKQKAAAAATAAQTKLIKEQNDALKRLATASGGFASAVGVSPNAIEQADLVAGARITEEAERLSDIYTQQVAELARRKNVQKEFLEGIKAEEQRIQRMFLKGIATTEEYQKHAALQEQIAKSRAFVERADRDAVATREKMLRLDDERFNLIGKIKLKLDPTGGTPGAISDPGADVPTGAGQAVEAIATQQSRVNATLVELFKRNTVAYFQDLIQALRLEQLDINPERSTLALTAIGDAFKGLKPVGDAVVETFAAAANNLDKMAMAAQRAIGESRFLAQTLTQVKSFGIASAEAVGLAAVQAAFYGESVQKAMAAAAKSTAVEATFESLKSLARAAGAAAVGDPKASLHLKSAALWGAAGAAAGVAGAALGGGGGGGGASAFARTPTRRDLPRDNQRDRGNSITVVLDMKSRPFATQRDVEDAALRGATNALRRAGGGGAAFRRALGAA